MFYYISALFSIVSFIIFGIQACKIKSNSCGIVLESFERKIIFIMLERRTLYTVNVNFNNKSFSSPSLISLFIIF